MDPKNILISDYSYELIEDRIALHPNPERDSSKLLIVQGLNIKQDSFRNIASHLPTQSLIIFNNTRVIAARLLFEKTTGARIEVFCLEPAPGSGDTGLSLASRATVTWKCFVGNASAWNPGMVLDKNITSVEGDFLLHAKLLSFNEDHFLVQLSWEPQDLTFAEILQAAGAIPLPPYIKRLAEPEDSERYQTVYALLAGSVAAPTAGLHFTERTFRSLEEKEIEKDFVTLHVGAGTFKPVKSKTLEDHQMHSEYIEINYSLVENLVSDKGRKIIAVGTTSLRTLESLYWIGKKLMADPALSINNLNVQQWEPYESTKTIPSSEALNALKEWMKITDTSRLIVRTSLLIVPGYQFKIVDILITNFHQPGSTLLLLVAAFIGEEWKSVYTYALDNNFRFLSYGDACLFFRQEQVHEQQEAQA